MARELQQTAPDDRRRRVQRLKKMIIGIVIVGLLIPILCCVYLICRLHAINGTLRDLEQRLEELDARDRERQTLLQQLQSETAIQQGVVIRFLFKLEKIFKFSFNGKLLFFLLCSCRIVFLV